MPNPPPLATVLPVRLTWGGRLIRLPAHWVNYEPPPPPPSPPPDAIPAPPRRSKILETEPDTFGMYHQYLDRPQQQPAPPAAKAVYNIPQHADLEIDPAKYPNIWWMNRPEAQNALLSLYRPFKAKTVYLLCEWFYNSANMKSLDDLDSLVEMLNTSGFKISDLMDFRVRQEMKHLDEYVSPSGVFSKEDGWTEGEIELPLPKPRVHHKSEADTLQDRHFSKQCHWIPHRTFWNPPGASVSSPLKGQPSTPQSAGDHSRSPPPMHMFSETYNSDAMNQEYAKLRARPRNPVDALSVKYGILPIVLWSDATLLALFGSAKLWPIYLYIANISKYIRGMPTDVVTQHVAYVPEVSYFVLMTADCSLTLCKLPDELLDYY